MAVQPANGRSFGSARAMIKLTDLIQLAGVTLDDYKIHCATSLKNTHLDAYFAGEFKSWQEHQNKENFKSSLILSLIHLESDRWLFAGLYKVLEIRKIRQKGTHYFKYDTEEIDGLAHLSGMAVISFRKTFRASYLRGKKYGEKLIVSELRTQKMSIGDFPGFNAVVLSFHELQTIIREKIPSWKSALSNVAGIYLITDKSNGKHYVGSACGEQGIWKRWEEYANNKHGGNKELKSLLKTKGSEHSEQFQFSLLEICSLQANTETVIHRECHWKKVLNSRESGLNSN